MGELFNYFHKVDIIIGDGLAHFLCLRLQDVQSGRAGCKIDVVTGEIVGLLSGDIVKPERFRSCFQGLVNDILSKDCTMFFSVNPAAAVREHGQNRFIVNLDSKRTQYLSCFGNNLFDKLVGQEFNSWSHRNVLSIVFISHSHIPHFSNTAKTYNFTYIPNLP